MSEGTRVFNQEEVLQDCKQVARNCEGAIEEITKDVNAGKNPSRFMGCGGEDFNPLTDMMAAKGGVAATAAQVYADVSNPGRAEDRLFNCTDTGARMTKAEKARRSKYCDYNMLTGEASYSKKKENARMRDLEMQGRAPKSKDPFMSGGAAGSDVFGNKKHEVKPRYKTKDEIRNTIGKKFEESRLQAGYEEDHRSTAAVAKGAAEGKQDMVAQLPQHNIDAVIAATDKMTGEAQTTVLKHVMKDDDIMTAKPLLATPKEKRPALPQPSWMEMPKPPGSHHEKRDN